MQKKYFKYKIIIAVLAIMFGISSCTKNFGETNSNPQVVVSPDLLLLLSYSQDQIVNYQGAEWVWESMEQLYRFVQYVSTDPYEMTANVNSRYNSYYQRIFPNLFEIRRQIDLKPDKDSYKKMEAITYVLQVLHGIKVTDMNGSIVYSQANQGRYDKNFNPAYDKQVDLFNTWLKELDDAIASLSNNALVNQKTYGQSDLFYAGDPAKWVKLANSLKLRIASRLLKQDEAKAKIIFQQVMQNAIGPISTMDAQLSYQNFNYVPFGTGDINYRSPRFASTSFIGFLKAANDPRISIYFEQNGLQGSYKDTLTKYGASLPAFINSSDPLITYQGGPAEFITNPTIANYIKNPFTVGNTTSPGNTISTYFLISPLNRRFFSPRFNNPSSTAQFKEVIVGAAEVCFSIAEFIEKGLAAGVNTNGTAEDWYKKGIEYSIKTMNSVAVTAASTTAYTNDADGDLLIAAYKNNSNVKFNGSNNLERIYIQQYINLFRNPNEAFVFCRRTGYPKKTSAYYAREPFNETIPRRFWTLDPGELNRSNWNAAMQEQGFTPNSQDLPTLSTQRIWYDKTAPAFGEGQ